MMHRRWRYDVMLRIMMLLVKTRNDAMFAIMCREAHIIRRSRHHWRSQHHLPERANIIQKSRFVFGQIGIFVGAGDVTRTHDLLITNQLHYRLCYTSILSFTTYLLYPILSFLSILFFKKGEHFFFLFPSLLIL